MNIEGSVHSSTSRADSARGARSTGGEGQEAGAFGGLFAGLVDASAPAEPASARSGPSPTAEQAADAQMANDAAVAGAPADEPELPIWPGLVQGALPDTPATAQQAADADGAESLQALATTGQPPASPLANQNLAATDAESTADAAAAMAQLVEVDAAGEGGREPADELIAATDIAVSPNAQQDAAQAVSAAASGQSPTAGADHAVVAAEQAQRQAAAQASLPGAPAGADTVADVSAAAAESRGPGAEVVRDASRLPATAAPTAQAAGQIILPDTAADMARQNAAELAGTDASEAMLLRAAAAADSGRESTTASGLLLNTSPTAPQAATRAADMPLPMSTPTQQPVPADQLAQHAVAVIRQLGDGRSEARIQLHPAELGHLDLELKHDGQRLELSVAVDSEQSRRLVQDQLAQWRERLADAGMNLQRLDVQVRDQNQNPRQNSDVPVERAAIDSEAGVNNPAPQLIRDPNRALDIYA